jgi:protein-S-isoprenylcysteine O-methyltransferase Ste14
MNPGKAIAALWGAWAISWLVAALWSRQARKRLALGPEFAYRVPIIVGGVFLFIRTHGYEGPLRLWHPSWMAAWLCAALVALGFAFTWWARIYLGNLWSASVQLKEGHRIVDTGPYAIVRHPIYTGLLLSVFATAGAKGTVYAIVGALLVTLGFWMKARAEETWLRQELGAEAYDDYRRRVPMLLPFGPRYPPPPPPPPAG